MKKSTSKQSQEKAVLVIWDSMVKHIDGNKIGRAARSKAISHSYSGATVNRKSWMKTMQRNSSTTPLSYMFEQTTWCMKNQTWKVSSTKQKPTPTKSLLNRSNLHLNQDSNKALRSLFTYLKSDRISTRNSNNHFFPPPSGRMK